jgi:hypothetical protein
MTVITFKSQHIKNGAGEIMKHATSGTEWDRGGVVGGYRGQQIDHNIGRGAT